MCCHLKNLVKFSSLKIHLATISANHTKIQDRPLFSYSVSLSFLVRWFNLITYSAAVVPVSDSLPTHINSISILWLLSFKVTFWVAITLAGRVGELAALRADYQFIKFQASYVWHFLPKVVSSFHFFTALPILFRSPTSETEKTFHSLDAKISLSFYLDWTKILIDGSLFAPIAEGRAGVSLSGTPFWGTQRNRGGWWEGSVNSRRRCSLPGSFPSRGSHKALSSPLFLHFRAMSALLPAAHHLAPSAGGG